MKADPHSLFHTLALLPVLIHALCHSLFTHALLPYTGRFFHYKDAFPYCLPFTGFVLHRGV